MGWRTSTSLLGDIAETTCFLSTCFTRLKKLGVEIDNQEPQ